MLTPREWQVADLIQDGLTNEEIGHRLQISLSGVKYHVSEILAKLGVSSRSEAVQLLKRYRDQRRSLPLFVWPFNSSSSQKSSASAGGLAAFGALALALIGIVSLSLYGVLGTGSRSQRPGDLPVAESGLDVGQEGQALPNQALAARRQEGTLLLARSLPTDVGGDEGTVHALRRVRTVAELEAAIHPGVNLIVVDRSSLADVRNSDILYRQLKQGRLVMGLNISNTELRELSQFVRVVNERRLDGRELRPPETRPPSVPSEDFYSLVIYAERQGDTTFVGGYQRYFSEERFLSDLGNHDKGGFAEEPHPVLRIKDLPEERISLNRGMGCLYDDAKTAAVVKRELVAMRPDLMVSELMVVYCNAGPGPTVVLGVLLPAESSDPQVFTPPAGCVDASGRPSSEPRCMRPLRTTSAATTVRITVALAEVLP